MFYFVNFVYNRINVNTHGSIKDTLTIFKGSLKSNQFNLKINFISILVIIKYYRIVSVIIYVR